MRHLLSLILALFVLSAFGQGENNWWYWGQAPGLDFNGGAPVVELSSPMSHSEGSATISDENGNLLFYTDGVSVWDSTHTTMPNGTGLLGSWSTTQSAAIVNHPGNDSLYYIFTCDQVGFVNGFRYTVVDMTLNGGKGDVITTMKNQLLHTPTTEGVTVSVQPNCSDYWVISQKYNTDSFYVYEVTSAGLNTTPVKSRSGTVSGGGSGLGLGTLKVSPNQKLLCSPRWIGAGHFELHDFNNSTGVVSGMKTIDYTGFGSNYGCEFSPNSDVLYGTSSANADIVQFDLTAGSGAAISATSVVIGSRSTGIGMGGMQLAPDGQIYCARPFTNILGIIQFPDSLGTACSYQDTGINVTDNMNWGLSYYTRNGSTALQFSFNGRCWMDTTFFSITSDTADYDSILWIFDDVTSPHDTSTLANPSYVFQSAGIHRVALIKIDTNCADTTWRNVYIQDSLGVTAMVDTTICDTSSIVLFPSGTSGTPLPYSKLCGVYNVPLTGTTTTHTVGTSPSSVSVPSPFFGLVQDERMQILYTAGDFAGMDSGVLSEISFDIASKFSSRPYLDFTIKMKCTSKSSLSTAGGWETGTTLVYGPTSVTTTTGWNDFTLDKTFSWDGASNIIVEICWDNTGTSLFDAVRSTATGYNSVIMTTGIGSGCSLPSPTAQHSTRPNTRFKRNPFPTARDFVYCWSPGSTLVDSTARTPVTIPTATPTTYVVTIKTGECVSTDSVFVDIIRCSVLPVELLEFKAERADGGALISWLSANEVHLDGYFLQRREAGKDFENLKFFGAKGAGFQYAFLDENPLTGKNYYRLKAVDLDGQFEYSEIRSLEFWAKGSLKLYPNPLSNGNLFLDISSLEIPEDQNIEIRLLDVNGKTLFAEGRSSQKSYSLDFPQNLAPGVYLIELTWKGNMIRERFIRD